MKLSTLLLLLLIFLPCTGRALDLTERDNGKNVSLTVGESMVIELAGNPTTGYGWELADIDQSLLASETMQFILSDSNLTGAGGHYSFRFNAFKAGSSVLKLVYRRVWEKNVQPLQNFELMVAIKPSVLITTSSYRTSDGKTATAVFDQKQELVTLTLPDGRRVSLRAAVSASGIRYSDHKETFWEHQGVGRFFNGETLIFEGKLTEQ